MPQFLSSAVILTAVLVVSQLARLTEVLAAFGLSLENIFLPFLYIVLPFMSFNIPIAYLFAVMISFGRLSADGEWAALLASGYSLARAAIPVMIIAVFLYGLGLLCSMHLEAWGRRELVNFTFRKTQTEVDNMIKFKLQPGVFMDNFLGFVLYAEKISPDRSRFENMMLAPGPKMPSSHSYTMLAPVGRIVGSVEEGELKLAMDYGMSWNTSPDGEKTSVLKFRRAEIDLLRIFREQIVGGSGEKDDYRSMRPGELAEWLRKLRTSPDRDDKLYWRAHYLYHQRMATPFAVVTFALFAMVLGVADPRRGKNWAYVGAILTIMGGYVTMMGLKWFAEQGTLDAALAVWLPNGVLFALGLFLLYQKNRLPPSESPIDLRNMPWVKA